MLSYDHTRELFVLLGFDPATVLASGADETGFLVWGRHPEGLLQSAAADAPEISRVSWPTSDAFKRFQAAQLADGVLPPSPSAVVAAAAVERAANWLDARRDATWNGGERRPSNFARAAAELREYAAGLRNGSVR